MKPNTRIHLFIAIVDIALVIFGIFLILLMSHGFSIRRIDQSHLLPALLFIFIWIVVSHFSKKYRIKETYRFRLMIVSILKSNFIFLGLLAVLMFIFRFMDYSRLIVLGSVLLVTLFEFGFALIYHEILHSKFLIDWIGPDAFSPATFREMIQNQMSAQDKDKFALDTNSLLKVISMETGNEAAWWIMEHLYVSEPEILILSTTTRFNVENQPVDYYTGIVNLKRINDIQRINKFFESVSRKLSTGGLFIGCAETYSLRKSRILGKYPPLVNYIVYSFDFFFWRILPKLLLTQKIYFLFTKGKNRVLSRTETLGRLYSCGFEVIEEKSIDKLMYWLAVKVRPPYFDKSPTYGLIVRLRRIGRDGKEFNVFKLRTMHAYSEYIQNYVYEAYHLGEGGKFDRDFRVSTLGRFFRKFWLDELPMLINVVKGDMKIVGVRPLSRHYFSLYSKELQEKRTRYKPGLIPPYYAQFPPPKTLDDIQRNEMEYLLEYEKHPVITDTKYFFRALYNILIKKARSR